MIRLFYYKDTLPVSNKALYQVQLRVWARAKPISVIRG